MLSSHLMTLRIWLSNPSNFELADYEGMDFIKAKVLQTDLILCSTYSLQAHIVGHIVLKAEPFISGKWGSGNPSFGGFVLVTIYTFIS